MAQSNQRWYIRQQYGARETIMHTQDRTCFVGRVVTRVELQRFSKFHIHHCTTWLASHDIGRSRTTSQTITRPRMKSHNILRLRTISHELLRLRTTPHATTPTSREHLPNLRLLKSSILVVARFFASKNFFPGRKDASWAVLVVTQPRV